MTVPHFSVSIVSRGDAQRGAVGRLSPLRQDGVRTRSALVDYTRKQGLLHEEFSPPPDAPQWLRSLIADHSVAGAAKSSGTRSRLARNARMPSLQGHHHCLADGAVVEQNIALVRDFVERHISPKGMVADWVYHDAPGNPHVHLIMTLRPLTEDGFGAKKIAVIGENGEVLRNTAARSFMSYGQAGSTTLQRFAMAGSRRRTGIWRLAASICALMAALMPSAASTSCRPSISASAPRRSNVNPKATVKSPRLSGLICSRRSARRNTRFLKRPEIVLDMISSERSVFNERDVAKILHRYVDEAATFQHLWCGFCRAPRHCASSATASTLRQETRSERATQRAS